MREPVDDDRQTVDLGPRPEPEPSGELDDDDADGAEDSEDDEQETRVPAELDPFFMDTNTVERIEPVHVLPTQALPVRRRRKLSASLTRHSSLIGVASPAETMRQDEAVRTQVFLKIALATCVGGVLIALVASGDAIAQRVEIAGSMVSALGCVWMLALTANPATYEARRVLPPAVAIAFGAMAGVYYWGAASPVAAMITYGLYFFSLGANRRITTAIWILVSVLHGALGIGIISGALIDRGVVQMSQLRTVDQVAIILVIEALYFIAFITARLSQRVTLQAVSSLEQAVRSVAQREALLAEARADLDRALKIGGPGRFSDQVVGTFRLGVLIGRGGMGEVYEARGVSDRRDAAVKLLHPGTLAEPNHVQRFLREAQTASRLDCPHVVRVLEVGTTTGEVPFIAMERLRGNDLAHQLRRKRRLQLVPTGVLVDQVAIGLEAARAAGIVHRDLKPHNVFLAEDRDVRRWKILDFGVSKAGGNGTLTQGNVVGTPAYMAPEQARGEDVDHRADVYSLAAMIYRAITGHPAFTGKDVPTTLYDVVYRVATQPSLLAPLPADVDRVLAIGLAKDARDRFTTARELARWFSAAIANGLEPDQRRRADELIAKHPWGSRPTAR